MVTANRLDLAKRAIECFARQTWSNAELVIVDDGDVDYSAMVESSAASDRISYHRLFGEEKQTLGALRNLSMELAAGRWLMQWDDDEWYHPDRISTQFAHAQRSKCGASALRWTLTSVTTNSGELREFRSDAGIATPGTLLFRAGSYRYPHLARNEDGVFMRSVLDEVGLAILGRESSHLFVRVHHGSNTWDTGHFMAKLRRTPRMWPRWFIARYLRGDITTLPSFDLSPIEMETLRSMHEWNRLNVNEGTTTWPEGAAI